MQSDIVFGGSISSVYDEYLVPLLFEHYADDLARRVVSVVNKLKENPNRATFPIRVLELAAGTGVVTRAMAKGLAGDCEIVATDLNPAMLEVAERRGTARTVQWQLADAMQLPFDDATFDVVVCQFGVMFFPDKARAFAESHRVLREGGHLLFNVWDDIALNDWASTVTDAMAALFPDNPAKFMARVPHGYFEHTQIERDVRAGGFDRGIVIQSIPAISHADSALHVAIALCQGTPLRNELEARGGETLAAATNAAAGLIQQRFGSGKVYGRMQAVIGTVQR